MPPTVVVKIGGNAAVDVPAVCADIAALAAAGVRVVLVHGGSADIESLAGRLGVPSRRLLAPDGVSTRRTDARMLEVVVLALTGLTKPRVLAALAAAGVTAAGLTGLDAGLLRARRKRALRAMVDGRATIVRDDHSGRLETVAPHVLTALLDRGIVPVVSPPALAEDGAPVNVDADRVAAALAGALDTSALVLLTGAPGVLADGADEQTLLPVCAVPRRGAPPITQGGIGTKLIAARDALLAGAEQVVIADGRVSEPVRKALAGAGTRIVMPDRAQETTA